jgi:hypothetical protein
MTLAISSYMMMPPTAESIAFPGQFRRLSEPDKITTHGDDFSAGTAVTIVSVVLLLAITSRARKHFRAQLPSDGSQATDTAVDAFAHSEDWRVSENRFCPLCLQECAWPAEQCEDCGVSLVEEDDLPTEKRVLIEESVIPIARLQNLATAHLAWNYLLANEVPCSLRSSMWSALSSDVLVFESDALRAKRLLNRFLYAAAA